MVKTRLLGTPETNQEINTKEQNKEAAPEETVNLAFVEADDVPPGEKPSRLKKAFKNVFLTEDANESKPARKKKSTFFVKNSPLAVGGLLFCIHLLTPDEYKEAFVINDRAYSFVPTQEQMSEIIVPLARIADRHTNITEINPDLLDILASGQACAAYGLELRATIMLKRFLDEKDRKEKQAKQVLVPNWRDYVSQDTSLPFSDMSNHFGGGETVG